MNGRENGNHRLVDAVGGSSLGRNGDGVGLDVLDPYLSLSRLSAYSGLSVRTLRGYVDGLPGEALPSYRPGGKILVRRSEFDAWIAQFRTRGRPCLAQAARALGLA